MIQIAEIRILPILAAAVFATIGSYSSVRAQSGSVSMTPPTCEAYQRERPHGGPWEQLSSLFGLSIYRWTEADYGRYRNLLLDCKRSLPGFREDTTARDWEATIEKSVTNLKSYTGFMNRLGEPMANRYGPRPRAGEPDSTLAFQTLSCDRFNRQTVNAWPRGGAPIHGPDAPFSVPLAGWTYEVWRAFENRVKNCVQLPGSEAETERDWLHTLVFGQEVQNEAGIRQAQQDAIGAKAKLAGILARAAEAQGLTSADDIASRLQAVETLATTGPKLGRADEEEVTAAKDRIVGKLRAARTAESEAWERDRPAREARARTQEQDVADLQRRNQDREAEAAAERERTSRMEAERKASALVQAQTQAKSKAEDNRNSTEQLIASVQAQEKKEAEDMANLEKENQARLATDTCNKIAVRRQMMDAANAIDLSQFRGQKLLDLTNGRTQPAEPNVLRSCMFVADWSSGQRGFVTITVRKNSFGEQLVEVRPF